jgi:hypothetical protein
MPDGIVRDPVHNYAQVSKTKPGQVSSPNFADYGFLEGENGHLLMYIKDKNSWPLIAGTKVQYTTGKVTFKHGGKKLVIDVAIIKREIKSPYVSLINKLVEALIGKPKEKKGYYTQRLVKKDIDGKQIR